MYKQLRGPASPWLACLVLLVSCGKVLSAANVSNSIGSGQWWLIRPPTSYFEPDVDTTQTTPFPRVPPSPYGPAASICPQADGVPYSVGGYPGTPYIITPFSDLFQNPPELLSDGTVCRTGDTDPQHCMKTYQMEVTAFQARVFDNAIPACRAFPGTWLMGYNGITPGPTIHHPVGHEALIRVTNNIDPASPFQLVGQAPCTATRSGRPLAVHAHGSASLASFDGWAEDNICFGETKEYVYPSQRPATGWYHDHALHITLDNAYHGLAGFFSMTDTHRESGCTAPYNLNDIEEKVMMLKDAVLQPDCNLYYDYQGPHNRNFFGDINTINGVAFPEMPLEPKWYHFRILNAAVSRPYLVKIKDEFGRDVHHVICKVFGADGGYRSEAIPFPPEGLQLANAERYDVACNFERFRGRQLYLWNGNNGAMFKDVAYYCHSHLLALLTISRTTSTPNPPAFDERLIPANPMYLQKVLTPADFVAANALMAQDLPHRIFEFNRNGGLWTINGEGWATATIAAADVGQNTWELWHITTGGGWFHPVHMHMVDFFILKRGKSDDLGDGLFAYERGVPKDMLFLGPGEDIWVLTRFGAHRGNYMFHCHNLVHEDHDMMRAYVVVGGAGQDNQPVLNPSTTLIVNEVAGLIYNNNELNDAMAAAAAAKPTAQWPLFDTAYWQSQLDRNYYRIFYPQSTDDPRLQADQNPWYAQVCATLPLAP